MARSPLFDIFDPEGLLQQQASMGLLPGDDEERDYLGVIPLKRKPTVSDLMPEEEQRSFLRTLSQAGSSGLAGLGWLLDTPGAVVRGSLSGGLGKGLSALWETSDDRVTGRELLRQYGLVGQDDTWGSYAGGLATEVLLDPSTYLSLGLNQVIGRGAKTLAGEAAQNAGLLKDFDLFARNVKRMGPRQAARKSTPRELLENIADPTVRAEKEAYFRQFSDDLDSPIARMNRLGLPWTQQTAMDFFGESVGDAAAKFGDDAAEFLAKNPYTGPAVRGVTAAFDPDVLGRTDLDQQWDAREITAARRAREAVDRKSLSALQFDAEEELRQFGKSLNDKDISEGLRKWWEGSSASGLDDILSEPLVEGGAESLPKLRQLLTYWDDYRQTAKRQADALGMPLKEFQSRAGTEFFPRQQLGFDVPELPSYPEGVVPAERLRRVRRRGKKAIDVSDTMGARRPYTDVVGGADTINRMSLDNELQEALRQATPEQARGIIDRWAKQRLGGRLYDWVDETDADGSYTFTPPPLPKEHPMVKQKEALEADIERAREAGDTATESLLRGQLDNIAKRMPDMQRKVYKDELSADMGDFLRSLDPQHARTGRPIFGQNSFNEMSGYVLRRGAAESDAQQALRILKKNMERQAASDTVGGVNYTAKEAAAAFGLTGDTAEQVLARELGVDSLDNISFNKKLIDDWSKAIDPGRMPEELSPLMEAYDNFTKSFKTLALLFPSRYTRDAYSGAFSAASKGAYNWFDRSAAGAMRSGDYTKLLRRLKEVPAYRDLSDEEKIRKFLTDAGGQNLSQSTYADEIGDAAAGANMREMYPGAARPKWSDIGRRVYNPDRTWREAARDFNPFAVRTGSGNRNPLLELGDRAAETTDAWNRYGTYLTMIRKGVHPEEARRIADLTQVNYRPEAFTSFERNVMKRIAPFYSYTRGIIPYIEDQVVNQPAGLLGQSARAINRASEPTEETFLPEELRQTVAIPLPAAFGGRPGENLQRVLTNIDLPFADPINILSPGVGNNFVDRTFDAARKTGMNLLGMVNPLPKSILELITNRQFYTGRELSDAYSFLEQPFSQYGLGSLGRVLEQAAYNAPGGSRALGLYRQITDDRTSGLDKWGKIAINTAAGVKLKDVDQERTRRLAARNMLNQMLEATPGVRTYENITVPDDVLAQMPENQQKQYLLYRIIQAEAAKRARERKKQETALDPLQVLGVTERF